MGDWKTDKDFADGAEATRFWESLYGRALAGFESRTAIVGRVGQIAGNDVVLVHNNGAARKVQEKLRREYYGDDILFEAYHEHPGGRRIPGWAHEDLGVEMLAYGWLNPERNVRRAVLFLWPELKQTLIDNWAQWELEMEESRRSSGVGKARGPLIDGVRWVRGSTWRDGRFRYHTHNICVAFSALPKSVGFGLHDLSNSRKIQKAELAIQPEPETPRQGTLFQ